MLRVLLAASSVAEEFAVLFLALPFRAQRQGRFPPQFMNASRFVQGVAHVRIEDDNYAWIRSGGTVVLKYVDSRRGRSRALLPQLTRTNGPLSFGNNGKTLEMGLRTA